MVSFFKDGEVWRGGLSTLKIKCEQRGFSGDTCYTGFGGRGSPGIVLSTTIASKGGGSTTVDLYLPVEEFEKLRSLMAEAEAIKPKAVSHPSPSDTR